MSNELAVREPPGGIIRTMADAERAAQAMAQSGFFQDTRQAAQAVVKILAGQEMGFGPFAAMTGVYIIQGRPAVGANLMAAAVKRSGRYDYRITEMSDKACRVTFYQSGEVIGESVFTLEDARKAGTKNLDKFPRNMLFARAISNGVRWFCPDVFSGAPIYTPEELGAVVDSEGNVVEAQFTEAKAEPQPAPAHAPARTAATAPQPAPVKPNGGAIPTNWFAFAKKAVDELGYSATPHVTNTLKAEGFGPWSGDNAPAPVSELWAILEAHQAAKSEDADASVLDKAFASASEIPFDNGNDF